MKQLSIIFSMIIIFIAIIIFISYNISDVEELSAKPSPIQLQAQSVTLKDGTEVVFNLASDFDIDISAEDLGWARFPAWSPDGKLFVPDMITYGDNSGGKIYILDNFNEDTHRFENRSTYLSNLRNPNSITFYEDDMGKYWIYVALTDRLIRYPYQAGDKIPSGEPEVIVEFPDYQTVDSGPWHFTRTIVFHADKLYVSVGSSCNVCEENENEIRAEIIVMTPTGEDIQVYADGLRNAVGLAWAEDKLYATVNGVDHHGMDAPDDLLYQVEEGENYGFPYCYEENGEVKEENDWEWNQDPISCDSVPLSFVAFGSHTAPLGVTYFERAHPTLQETFLVALHGSYRVEIGHGYSIMRVTKDGDTEVFMDGFLKEGGLRIGRPVQILQGDDNSFFFTDDYRGRLYHVYAKE